MGSACLSCGRRSLDKDLKTSGSARKAIRFRIPIVLSPQKAQTFKNVETGPTKKWYMKAMVAPMHERKHVV